MAGSAEIVARAQRGAVTTGVLRFVRGTPGSPGPWVKWTERENNRPRRSRVCVSGRLGGEKTNPKISTSFVPGAWGGAAHRRRRGLVRGHRRAHPAPSRGGDAELTHASDLKAGSEMHATPLSFVNQHTLSTHVSCVQCALPPRLTRGDPRASDVPTNQTGDTRSAATRRAIRVWNDAKRGRGMTPRTQAGPGCCARSADAHPGKKKALGGASCRSLPRY